MLYLHGGGWVIGSLAGYDGVARNLCRDNGCVVVAVDYRLAPELRFPAASDDCLAALAWCMPTAPPWMATQRGSCSPATARVATWPRHGRTRT